MNIIIKLLLVIMWSCIMKWLYIYISECLIHTSNYTLDYVYKFDITKTIFCFAGYLLVIISILFEKRRK